MGLFVLGALRGLWGFCARVKLGGFGTCCVFASLFLLSFLCLLAIDALCFCLSSCLVFVLFVFVVVVSFSLSDYMDKKKGRAVLVRPLLSCCGLLRCRCLDLFASSVDCISCRYFVMSADYFAECVNPAGSFRN